MPESTRVRDPWQHLYEYGIVRKCCHHHGRSCVIASQMTATDAEALYEGLAAAGVATEIVAGGATPTWQ